MAKKVGEILSVEKAARWHRRDLSAGFWWAIATTVLCTLAVVIAGVVYTNSVARESERKWCGIVVTLDDSYAAPRPPGSPPLTSTGQRIIEEMRRLRREFGC